MSEHLPTRPTPPPDGRAADAERDAKIDELLLSGLDHYFAGRFQEAVNVWGRVLFLDRGHARARAYIERARSAMAERQRSSEQLLHEGVAAFQRGDGSAARELLTSAVDQGGPQDLALAYLDRLDRLEGPIAPPEAVFASAGPPAARREASADGLWRGPRPVRVWPLLLLAVVAGFVAYLAASGDLLGSILMTNAGWRRPATAAASHESVELLPVPRTSEIVMAKARALYASGRLKDALETLGTVARADPFYGEAERLRSQIQRALLASLESARAADLSRPPGGAGLRGPGE